MVDNDVPADGKGLGKGERPVVKYENGQQCWNGPNRSTRVVMACTEKDEIWKISQSGECVYRMEVGTAAVCEANRSGFKEKSSGKDEL
jgi:protein kinase C substrate 80K-H